MKTPGSAPTFLSDVQRGLLTSVLNQIIPSSGSRPGAGDAGGAAGLELVATAPSIRRAILDVIADIETISSQMFEREFLELDVDGQYDVLSTVETRRTDAFSLLVTLTYRCYYRDAQTLERLGLDPRPPEPRGFTLRPFDATQLEAVRRRGKIHRDVPR